MDDDHHHGRDHRHRRRAGDRRHDLRVVRQPDRAQAQQARRRAPPRSTTPPRRRGSTPRTASTPPSLVAQVEAAGYTAELPRPAAAAERAPTPRTDPTRAAAQPADRQRGARGAGDRAGDGPGAAVHLLAVDLADAGRAGRRCGRRGRSTGRRGRTCATAPPTMDTLISMGVLAAFALVAVRAAVRHGRRARHDAPVRADDRPRRRGRATSTSRSPPGVTTFLLAGRYFEARSKRRAGAALRALLELGAKDVAVLRDGAEVRDPDRAAGRRRPVRRAARREDRHRRRRRGGHARPSTPRCSPASRCRSRSGPATPWSARTVNAGGRLVVRATRVGADTQLAQMARLVEDAQNGKAAGAAAGRPDLRGVRADRDRARRGHARVLARHRAPAPRRRSPPRSPC